MNLEEAIDVARRMTNHFKAFEKLSQALVLASQAEQTTREAEKRKETLEAEILSDEEDFLKVRRERENKIIGLQKRIASLQTEVEEKTRWRNDIFAEISEAVRRKREEADRREQELKDRTSNDIKIFLVYKNSISWFKFFTTL